MSTPQQGSHSAVPQVRPRHRLRAVLKSTMTAFAAAGLLVLSLPAHGADINDFERSSSQRIQKWLGPDLTPLPFTSEEQILDFLATAEVVKSKELSSGSTKPLKVLLEKDGIRANAIFRTIDLTNGSGMRKFRDSYLFEVAAYETARLLGLRNVPPAVVRYLGRQEGSMQLWVEGARSESDRIAKGEAPASPSSMVYQKHMLRVFDHLIYNFDRNTGNILTDSKGQIWMIDHTRSFKASAGFPDGPEIVVCERDLWQRLKNLEPKVLKNRLAPHLSHIQLATLVKRHKRLVAHLEQLIAERGEDAVLYDLS